LRWSGFHLCIPNEPLYKIFKSLILTVIPKDMRRITRVHCGTLLECEYSLRCFGISTEDIPQTFTGKIKTKYLSKWIKVRTAMDDHRRIAAQNNYNKYYECMPLSIRIYPGIECPEINCVLFRLAGLASKHPGNVEFRLFLQEKEAGREKLKTFQQKDDYLHEVIKESLIKGYRFLLFNETRYIYYEIHDYEILRKHIFQAQRDISKRTKARKRLQQIQQQQQLQSQSQQQQLQLSPEEEDEVEHQRQQANTTTTTMIKNSNNKNCCSSSITNDYNDSSSSRSTSPGLFTGLDGNKRYRR
jgi:hypothetical protein